MDTWATVVFSKATFDSAIFFAQASYFTDFFEEESFARFIAINAKTGRIITTIFLARQTGT